MSDQLPEASRAPERESHRAALVRASRALSVCLAWVLLAVAPARWELAKLTDCAFASRLSALAVGLVVDASLLVVPCALVVAVGLTSERRAFGLALGAVLAVVAWASAISAVESFDSRGIFPSPVDAHISWQSPAMVRGSLDMFLATRWVVPSVLGLAAAVALGRLWPRPPPGPRRRAALLSLGVGLASWSWLGVAAWLLGGPRPEQRSPVGLVAPRELPEAVACAVGPCEPVVLLDAPIADDRAPSVEPTPPASGRTRAAGTGSLDAGRWSRAYAQGAALLGWPPPRPERRGAAVVARELPSRERTTAPVRAHADDLLGALGDLSSALFAATEEPVDLRQLVLEGARADDLHALHRAAPAELTPWLSQLAATSATGDAAVLVARHTWTAGLRTPHGLAALVCGLGTLPYGLTLSRDLPDLPVRCLPDLLADAGYSVGYAYGGSPGFDRMGQMLSAHGFEPRVTGETLGPAAARTGWGATDRALLEALRRTERSARPSYELVLTLSHHHPFVTPPDCPADALERAERSLRAAVACATDRDRERLAALAYTDGAVGEWFEALERSGRLDRSVVVVTADHPIPSRPLWSSPDDPAALLPSRAMVPLLVWISPRLLERAADRDRALDALGAAARELERVELSQNDVPTLLLALLERAPGIRELPSASRWHSMGGQATSPWYRAPCGARGRAHGIHAGTATFCVDDRGLPVIPEEPAPLVVTTARAREVAPSLQAAAPLLGALRRGWSQPDRAAGVTARPGPASNGSRSPRRD